MCLLNPSMSDLCDATPLKQVTCSVNTPLDGKGRMRIGSQTSDQVCRVGWESNALITLFVSPAKGMEASLCFSLMGRRCTNTQSLTTLYIGGWITSHPSNTSNRGIPLPWSITLDVNIWNTLWRLADIGNMKSGREHRVMSGRCKNLRLGDKRWV